MNIAQFNNYNFRVTDSSYSYISRLYMKNKYLINVEEKCKIFFKALIFIGDYISIKHEQNS